MIRLPGRNFFVKQEAHDNDCSRSLIIPSVAPAAAIQLQNERDKDVALRALVQGDPHFREAAFLDRATIIYLAIARARQEQEMHAINLLAGPALAQTLETEMQNLRTHHRTFRIAGL